jgi:hypothetical protein
MYLAMYCMQCRAVEDAEGLTHVLLVSPSLFTSRNTNKGGEG